MACSTISKEAAVEGAKVLVGCYRTGDASDPEVYARAVVAVLADYPVDVIHAVCDPRSGIPARLKWLPTIAEVKEACEVEMVPVRREMKREREREERAKMIERPRIDRPTYDDLIAKHGPCFGISQDDPNLGSWRKARWSPPSFEAMCEAAGVSVEQAEAEQEEARKWQKMRQRSADR